MSGGLAKNRVRCCAPMAVMGLASWLPWGTPCRAGEKAASPTIVVASDRQPAAAAREIFEQSIVVAANKMAIRPADLTLATDQRKEPPLEPIANASDYDLEAAAPDPADQPAAGDAEDVDAAAAVSDQAEASDAEARDDVLATLEGERSSPADSAAAEGATSAAAPVLGPACFLGVTPRLSTREEVLREWGVPSTGGASSPQLTYALDGFPEVVVFLARDQVELVRVTLPEPASMTDLRRRLGLDRFRPLRENAADGSLGATVFPERGVALLHEADVETATASDGDPTRAVTDPSRVFQIEVRSLNAGDFVRRAAQDDPRAYGRRVLDLQLALQLDKRNAQVHRDLSELKLKLGSAVEAERLAAEAVELAPKEDEYRLQWARCLTALARYDLAVRESRRVIDNGQSPSLVRAQALHQMGNLAALGSRDVVEHSVPLHVQAIEMADGLAVDDDPAVGLAAQHLLVDAHLAIAEQIAQGDYQRKDEFVAQWIARASALSEEMIAAGRADVAWRLKVASTALAVGGSLQPPLDPEPWIAEAEDAVQGLRVLTEDEDALAEIDWQLGLAYFHATEIEHRRGDVDAALRYGDVADALLAPLADRRGELPDASFLLGRLYFQVGAVYAVHREDHREACKWYDRAVDRLLRPMPVTTLAKPGSHGDALVSMGVSYWHNGRRARAYELTRAGAELVDQGIAEGLIAPASADVARENLASMSRALGKADAANPADEAAERIEVVQVDPKAVLPTPKGTATPPTPQAARSAARWGGAPRGALRR
jgi:tetratricopeptide (TPR) repeat protein